MKRILYAFVLACVLLLQVQSSSAQVSDYGFSQSVNTFVPLTNSSILTPSPFVPSSLYDTYHIGLPFTFTLDTVSSDSLWINLNGYAYLKTNNQIIDNFSSTPVTNNMHEVGVMSPFAASLYAGTVASPTGAIKLDTTGVPPSRIFIVEWTNLYESGYYITFQLQLHETSNVIDFIYGPKSILTSASSSINEQVGLRSVDTTFDLGGVAYRSNLKKISINSYQILNWSANFAGNKDSAYSPILSLNRTDTPVTGLTFTWVPPTPCGSISSIGTLPATIATCLYNTVSLHLATPAGGGLAYQWQTSTDNGNSWHNVTDGYGATYQTYITAPIIQASLYRLMATCTQSGQTFYTNSCTITPSAPLTVPYTEGFESATASSLPACMRSDATMVPSVLNAAAAHTGNAAATFSSINTGTVYLFTPGIILSTGKHYRFSFWYVAGTAGDTLSAAMGYKPTDTAMNILPSQSPVVPTNTSYQRVSYEFTVAVDSVYFMGIKWQGNGNVVDDIELIEVPQLDAAVDSVTAPVANRPGCLGTNMNVTIAVRNAGQQNISNVPVYYSLNGATYGPETVSTVITPGSTYKYTFTHQADLSGLLVNYNLRAWSALSGDGSVANDTSLTDHILSDTLYTVPYVQHFIFPDYSQVPHWKQQTYFYYEVISEALTISVDFLLPNSRDTLLSPPVDNIQANTFLLLGYNIANLSSIGAINLKTKDTIFIAATNDCGLSYQVLATIDSANQPHGTLFTSMPPISLAAYTGSTVRIAFIIKSANTNNYTGTRNFNMDNFQIVNMATNDAGITKLLLPYGNAIGCQGTGLPVKAIVKNTGGLPISGFHIKADVNGQAGVLDYVDNNTLVYNTIDTVTIGTYTPTAPGLYTIKVYTALTGDTSTANDTAYVSVYVPTTPAAPVVTDTSVCAGVQFPFTADANDTTAVYWYNSSTATTPLYIGEPYTTAPAASTTYYVEHRYMQQGYAGKASVTAPYSAVFFNKYGEILDVASDCMLDSLTIYPQGTGSITVNIMSCAGCASPVTIATKTISITGGNGTAMVVPMHVYLPADTGYFLELASFTGISYLLADFPFSGFPVTSNTPVTVRSCYGNNQYQYDAYQYFYHLAVSAFGCDASPRTPLAVTVLPQPQPAFAASQSGTTVTLTNTSQGGGIYHWDFEDGDTSNVAAPVHTYTSNGTYPITLTETNSCGSSSVIHKVTITHVGVGDVTLANDNFKIYPNPAKSELHISLSSHSAVVGYLQIYNAQGVSVQHSSINLTAGDNNFAQDISTLTPGNYWLLLQQDGGVRKVTFTVLP